MNNQPNTSNSSTMNEQRFITNVTVNEENAFGIQIENEIDRYKKTIHGLKESLDGWEDGWGKVMDEMMQINMDDPKDRNKVLQFNKQRRQIIKKCREIKREMCQVTLRTVGLCDIKPTNPDAANASLNGLTTREVTKRIYSIIPEYMNFKARFRKGRVTLSMFC